MGYGIRQLRLSEETDDGDIVVNATEDTIEGFIFPEMSEGLYDTVCKVVSNILVVSITVIISKKCLLLQMARTAEHTFYATVALVFA